MATLQFKRVFNYAGSMDDALRNIKTKLTPSLAEGEPLICSYKENDKICYFLAIGAAEGRVVVHPVFDDQADFIASIKRYAGVDLTTMISDESDFTIELDADGRYIFKIKDDILNINWIQL